MAHSPDRSREHREFTSRPFTEQLKDLFSLHSGERRGSIVMMAILLLLFGYFAYSQWYAAPAAPNMEPLRAEMEAWLAARDSTKSEPEKKAELFRFDPNAIDRADWLRLGLSERQVQGIERWQAKGGRFRVKADLGRMYSLKPDQVDRLLPYVDLPDSLPKRDRAMERRADDAPHEEVHAHWNGEEEVAASASKEKGRSSAMRRQAEVNSADTTELVALPGIGPAFARGIVKYRERLGGYHSLDQLAEVYVLQDKPDAIARMRELLVVDTLLIRRIPLNTCTVEELAAHPYIRWKLAKPIIAYRQQHGPFREVAGIRAIPLIDEGLYRKLAPYLSVE